MGKAGKKVKSDRINALRKQYDAFLEEDKRRKERNEYILGRLDKIRYCTALVPLRHKPTILIDRRDHLSTSSSLSKLNKSSLDSPKQFDETVLLQEISKKYILIPKIKSGNEADTSSTSNFKPEFEQNGDWKSKYEILDQLKKSEKEMDTSVLVPENFQYVNYELQKRETQKYYNDKADPSISFKYELPEKDQKCIQMQNQMDTKIDRQPNKLFTNQLEEKHIVSEQLHMNVNTSYTLTQNNVEPNNSGQLETHAFEHSQIENTPTEPEAAQKDEIINNSNYKYPVEKGNEEFGPQISSQFLPVEEDKDIMDTEKVYPEDIQPVEVICPDDLIRQIKDTEINTGSENMGKKENVQYPLQSVNVQDFTPGAQVILQDGINVNPEGYPAEMYNVHASEKDISTYDFNRSSEIKEHVEDTVDSSGIEAFDAEQREMFYTEDPSENYGYHQDNLTEGYEQQLPVQGGDYSQSEAAVYYEGYDAEQAYPVEIGEHEEANQRYDPHYEQQYATNFVQQEEGYEQQVYTQEPQYEGDVSQIQEGLEQFQFEEQHQYDTVGNIEQQLDAEQGYNEQIIMNNIEKPIEDLQAKSPRPESPAMPKI